MNIPTIRVRIVPAYAAVDRLVDGATMEICDPDAPHVHRVRSLRSNGKCNSTDVRNAPGPRNPVHSRVHTLENAIAGRGEQVGGVPWIDHYLLHRHCSETRAGCNPALPAILALKYSSAVGSQVDRVWVLGVYCQTDIARRGTTAIQRIKA